MGRDDLERWCDELEASPRTVSTEDLLRFLRAAGATVRPGGNHGPVVALGKDMTLTVPAHRRELHVTYVKRAVRMVREVLAQRKGAGEDDDQDR
jgi:hypothetical protein